MFFITFNVLVDLVGLGLFMPLALTVFWKFGIIFIVWVLATAFMGIMLIPVITWFFDQSRMSTFEEYEDEEEWNSEIDLVYLNPNQYGPVDTQKILEKKYSEGYQLVGIWGDHFFFERNTKI